MHEGLSGKRDVDDYLSNLAHYGGDSTTILPYMAKYTGAWRNWFGPILHIRRDVEEVLDSCLKAYGPSPLPRDEEIQHLRNCERWYEDNLPAGQTMSVAFDEIDDNIYTIMDHLEVMNNVAIQPYLNMRVTDMRSLSDYDGRELCPEFFQRELH